MRAPCKIEGCERESRGRGWCGTHWMRWRKHGNPLVVLQAGVDYRQKQTCSVDQCASEARAQGLCNKHYKRMQAHGSVDAIAPSGRPLLGDAPQYVAVHKQLSRERGPARNHPCVDCGGTAQEWSYDGLDPNELTETVRDRRGVKRFEVSYSLDLARYAPRCCSCHRLHDARHKAYPHSPAPDLLEDQGATIRIWKTET